MTPSQLLVDAFDRLPPLAHEVVDGLDADALTWRADAEANTIAWLLWHTARGQDAQIADLTASEQVWTADGWAERFDLPFDAAEMGYGQDPAAVAAVRAPGDLLVAYLEAVTLRTRGYLEQLDAASYDDIVDDAWDPPVTAGARLVSILEDCVQHVGQAAYLRGMLDRR